MFSRKKEWNVPKKKIPLKWKKILRKEVAFYNSLNKKEQNHFEYKLEEFLLNCKITGFQTEVQLRDKILIAASAVIPVFKFPEWKYINLDEVLLYPNAFDKKFNISGDKRNILGMVGTGYMEGKMILSKIALRNGFDDAKDKRNTAIHEFIHLIDKMDGTIDGIPEILLDKPYILPWLDLIKKKVDEITEEESDINPYGGTSKIEFFAVASEYFFERPKMLSKKHPRLYKKLKLIFKHDLTEKNMFKLENNLGRNDLCVCNSGKKYKHCCA